MGVCGSGKGTIGLALVERCGGLFYDADNFHPPANIEKIKRSEPLNDADRAPWLARLAKILSKSTKSRFSSPVQRSRPATGKSLAAVAAMCDSSTSERHA